MAAAAKTIYPILQGGPSDQPKAASEFLGVAFFTGSRLPSLVMERLLTSLHDLLAPDTPPPTDAVSPLDFFSMAIKCSVLQDVARGLAYLHEQLLPHPPPLVGEKRSSKLRNGGQDSRPGRSSNRASYESFSHHDKGSRGLNLHDSRGHCTYYF